MPWQEEFLRRVGPSYFGGISCGEWLSLLAENRFCVAPSCWGRALFVSAFALPNTMLARLEAARFRRQWEQAVIQPPLFILGHYRSGTTHLHNILARDRRFAFLNAYQASYPHTFLSTEHVSSVALAKFLPRTRPFDNVPLGFDVPYEDEIAMLAATRISPYMTAVFPRRAAHYDRFLTLAAATPGELAHWKAGLVTLLQKLTLKYSRPLLLKSPPHTARVELLLELFPQAKFIHIHRDPYAVIQSTINMMHRAIDWLRLQGAQPVDWTARALAQWREMHDAYFQQRPLIPPGRLHELAFTDLERDPLGELRKLYTALDLPPFAEAAPAFHDYLESIDQYRKNQFPPLDSDLRARVAEACRHGFQEWGYAR